LAFPPSESKPWKPPGDVATIDFIAVAETLPKNRFLDTNDDQMGDDGNHNPVES